MFNVINKKFNKMFKDSNTLIMATDGERIIAVVQYRVMFDTDIALIEISKNGFMRTNYNEIESNSIRKKDEIINKFYDMIEDNDDFIFKRIISKDGRTVQLFHYEW